MKTMRFLFLLLPFSVQILFAAQMPAFKGNAAKAKEKKCNIEGAAISSSHKAPRPDCCQRMRSVGSWLYDLTKHMSVLQSIHLGQIDPKEALLKEEWVPQISAKIAQKVFKKTKYHDQRHADVLKDFFELVLFMTPSGIAGSPPAQFYLEHCQNSSDKQFTFFSYLISQERSAKYYYDVPSRRKFAQPIKQMKFRKLEALIKTKGFSAEQLKKLRAKINEALHDTSSSQNHQSKVYYI